MLVDSLRDPNAAGTVMLVVAHPDDEVVSAGSRLNLWSRLILVHVTDGSPANMADARSHGFSTREEYARARRDELKAALNVAGARPRLLELGIPDQAATHNIAGIASEVRKLVAEVQPDLVLTHPYEGGHPDHDACAAAVQLAVPNAARAEFTSYHSRGGMFHSCDFLQFGDLPVVTIELTPEQQSLKKRMLQCFRTQAQTLAPFSTEIERFRAAPQYDFSRPPHGGTLYYEQFPWGMTGKQFREIACASGF